MSQVSTEPGPIKSLLACRICWKVAFAAFLAILIVEAIVLIPSYRNYAITWQANQQDQVLAGLRAAILLDRDNAENPQLMSRQLNRLMGELSIKGWRIIPDQEPTTILKAGDVPRLNIVALSQRSYISGFIVEDYMDVGWDSNALKSSYSIGLRLDSSELKPALLSFIMRIVGIVAIISLFVTLVIMYVLNDIILGPVLELRRRLTEAGEDLSRSDSCVIHSSRNDELGDVIKSFNTLLLNTTDNIKTIRQSESALQLSKQDLEVKVKQRTNKLRSEVDERRRIEVQLRENEKHLYNLANYDDLTGLPNRLLAMNRLESGIAHAARHDCSGALMFIDLDNFKDINDTLGHARGDELLRKTAARLSRVLRSTDCLIKVDLADITDLSGLMKGLPAQSNDGESADIVARIGGDEFMVILPELDSDQSAAQVAERIRLACMKPYNLDGNEAFVSTSIGIATFPDDASDPHELMICADTALYAAKEAGRDNFHFFSAEMNQVTTERLNVESAMRRAIEAQEFELNYQPVINLQSNRIVAVEALLRWNSAELGPLSPGQFVPVAETSGLILPLGVWVLRESCRNIAHIRELGYPLRIAVNVSTRQLRDEPFVDLVKATLEEFKLPAQALELEITESLLVDKQSRPQQAIEELHDLGVRISIDDFGTGFSGLSYLRQFSIDTLKIDQSFIARVCHQEQDASLARTIITMAKNFNLEIIAEGVENSEQLAFLSKYGCDHAQGYLLGRPMPLALLLDFLKHR